MKNKKILLIVILIVIFSLIVFFITLNFKNKTEKKSNEQSTNTLTETNNKSISNLKSYTITFETNGGSEVSSITANEGMKINLPISKKDGYYFGGWYTASDGGTRISKSIMPSENITYYAHWNTNKIVCQRATTLHTEKCNPYSDDIGCYITGYKKNETITYGNLGTSGTLTSGDAFDCDVNGDGIYDEETERFYYVSDYYDTNSKSFNSNYAVLIYYNNVSEGKPISNESWDEYSYHLNGNINYQGPEEAKLQLPTTSEWSNVSLYKSRRQILAEGETEHDETSTKGGTLPTDFSYEGYAARLLTAKELISACGLSKVGNYTTGELDNCRFIMEKTSYAEPTNGQYFWWLETPYYNEDDQAWLIYSEKNTAGRNNVRLSHSGVRPVIEVAKSDISY